MRNKLKVDLSIFSREKNHPVFVTTFADIKGKERLFLHYT